MSRFLSSRYDGFEAYTPGEQPRDMKYLKLNTNESPFPPSQGVLNAVRDEASTLNLYSDPTCLDLCTKAAEVYGVGIENVMPVNGSDEILNFAFMTFCDKDTPIAYPETSYGFYPVLAGLHGIPAIEIPLRDDFTIDYRDFVGINKNIVIANPNAPTGIALPLNEIEEIIRTNPDNVVIIDEAYVDFGCDSAIPLISKYSNLIVTRTFSKSHSMAGARLGFGFADGSLIRDMDVVKYSTNPYNVNRVTSAAGVAALTDNDYYLSNCRVIAETREYTANALRELGFTLTKSSSNFLFAKSDRISGEDLYTELRKKGILIRHFTKPSIADYNRITVGTRQQMDTLIAAVKEIIS